MPSRRRIDLTLPAPPSVNNARGTDPRTGGVYLKKHYQAWIRAAGTSILAARPKLASKGLGPTHYGVRVRWAEGDAADIDNRIKALLDLLHQMGVTPDDRYARHLSVGYSPAVPAGYCQVRVWEIQRCSPA